MDINLKRKLTLWCLAYNVDPEVLNHPYVIQCAADNDPVDTFRAVRCNMHALPGRQLDNIGPTEQLQFIMLFH